MTKEDYKVVSDHAEDLADGRVLAPGEVVKLSKEDLEDPHNQRLLEEGKLLDVKANLREDSKNTEGKED